MSILTGAARGVVGKVRVRSQLAPEFIIDPFAKATGGAPNPIVGIVKPSITVFDPQGNEVTTYAPAGEPTENYYPYLLAGGAFAVVMMFVGVGSTLKFIAKLFGGSK